jgi:hypothetical protein
MASNNRGGSRGRSGRNNNPEGRNQYSGMMSTARDNPLTTAAGVGGAVAAGVFLWSRRNQISDQIGNLAEQISEWRDGMGWQGAEDGESGGSFIAKSGSRSADGRSQTEIAEEALTLKETGKTA